MKRLKEYITSKPYNFDYIDNLIITECNIERYKNSPNLLPFNGKN